MADRTDLFKWRATNIAQQWNALVPSGTIVRYFNVALEDDYVVTKTCSEAWVVCGSAMVKIEGRAGGVSIDHLQIVGEPA